MTTATAKAAHAAAPANLAHPSIRELDRPVKLTSENAPGWGSDVVADTLRALNIPYIALNPGASYRGLHGSIVNHAVTGDQSVEVLDLAGVILQRIVRCVGHPAACFPKNGLRSAGIPEFRAASSVNV